MKFAVAPRSSLFVPHSSRLASRFREHRVQRWLLNCFRHKLDVLRQHCADRKRPYADIEKTSLERRKAYYDQLAAMPAEERDQLFHERFDVIDTNHDGKLDPQERTASREKRRELYRQQAAERGAPASQQH